MQLKHFRDCVQASLVQGSEHSNPNLDGFLLLSVPFFKPNQQIFICRFHDNNGKAIHSHE